LGDTFFSTSYAALLWLTAISGVGRSTYRPLAVTILSRIFGRKSLGQAGLADTFMIESIPSLRREETLGVVYTFRMGIAAISPLLIGVLAELVGIEKAFLGLSVLPWVAAGIILPADEKPLG
jgi:hypothetical protein